MKSNEHDMSAFVKLDGTFCQEYKVNDKGYRVESFIESQPGGTFDIEIHRGPHDHNDYKIFVRLDGVEVSTPVFPSKQMSTVLQGRREGDTMRAFKYAPIKLSEEVEECQQDPKIISALGVIEVALRRVNMRLAAFQGPGGAFTKPQTASSMTFDEKSKKGALSLITDLGEPVVSAHTPKYYTTTPIDHEDRITFRFSYRVRAMLEAQGICPPAEPRNSPQPEEVLAAAPDVLGTDNAPTGSSNGVKVEKGTASRKRRQPVASGSGSAQPYKKKYKVDAKGVIDLDSD